MDRLTVILLIVGGLVFAALGITVGAMKLQLDTANATIETKTAEIALKVRELHEVKGDLDVSKQNADRMRDESAIALDAAEERAFDQQERAAQFARIAKDAAHAPPPPPTVTACADSPPVAAALRGLFDLQRAASPGGHLQTDGRIPAGQNPAKPAEVQNTASHP
ncbi:hypothetical protein J2J97_31865 (plasmid) [Rhizobium bangladeshense]|uniref:hypothetical protein n=1 Tax=Rhizobium bangladeshense TaxID=1138189 RepID=UPI001A98F870|nr:hypothetical protein [Rhizobium bangladeshense]QSY98669.1 hypothetical protein J2J97_31865 [Rhizobium bangladeshense]